MTAQRHGFVSRASLWRPGHAPEETDPGKLDGATSGLLWLELSCGAEDAGPCLEAVRSLCPGLDEKMLHDLLTPDEQPEGIHYGDGSVRLASSFSVQARRPPRRVDRGTPQGVGVLTFWPLELLAAERWLITCAHPSRTFRGAELIETGAAIDTTPIQRAVAKRWEHGDTENAGDLGVAVMYELALSYQRSQRELSAWLEDWELSLYVEDELENADELPELWGLMAVLRDWLNPLNPGGIRKHIEKAWLPARDHRAVVDVDDLVDKTLDGLARLGDTLRQSFGLLHLEQAEEQRRHSERMQHRIEIAAAVFLVPTLIVGFYGANTWVPGQGRHWGFYVMVAALILLSAAALISVMVMQRRSSAKAGRAQSERRRMHTEALVEDSRAR